VRRIDSFVAEARNLVDTLESANDQSLQIQLVGWLQKAWIQRDSGGKRSVRSAAIERLVASGGLDFHESMRVKEIARIAHDLAYVRLMMSRTSSAGNDLRSAGDSEFRCRRVHATSSGGGVSAFRAAV